MSMNAPWVQELSDPISAELPCGPDPEDTSTLAAIETLGLFGWDVPLHTPVEKGESRKARPSDSPEWREIGANALLALRQSKDFRYLSTLATALLRTDGLSEFAAALQVAVHWLEAYPDRVYPTDPVYRQNVLGNFADRFAVLDGLWRVPLIRHRQFGSVSLRTYELAAGFAAPREDEKKPELAHVEGAFAATAVDVLESEMAAGAAALTAAERLGTLGAAAGLAGLSSDLEPLRQQLAKVNRLLRQRVDAHPGRAASAVEPSLGDAMSDAGTGGAAPSRVAGAIGSRDDAIRALDAVASYFRQHEPSSPIPLFLDRAKRLVAKNFLEVLADVVPEAVEKARAAGGVQKSE